MDFFFAQFSRLKMNKMLMYSIPFSAWESEQSFWLKWAFDQYSHEEYVGHNSKRVFGIKVTQNKSYPGLSPGLEIRPRVGK